MRRPERGADPDVLQRKLPGRGRPGASTSARPPVTRTFTCELCGRARPIHAIDETLVKTGTGLVLRRSCHDEVQCAAHR